MEGLLIVLSGSGALAFLFALWLNTRKRGKMACEPIAVLW
nr:MAG TPA: toxin [Caudoviricetes sp.]